jgi:hypothetical protein
MLGNEPFNFRTIEKITAAFGFIFSDISFRRIDPDTKAIKTIKVPISQSAKEKWAVRDVEDPNAGDEARQRHVQIVLPRMGYEMTNFNFDPTRTLPPVNYRVQTSGNGPSALIQLNPVPQIFDFELYLQTRTLTDSYAIVEQIAAFFHPDYVVPIIDIPQMNIHRDIIFTMTGKSHSDSYEGSLTEKRVIEWNFNFQAQGHIYPPIREKKVITNTKVFMDERESVQLITDPVAPNIDEPYDIIETIVP